MEVKPGYKQTDVGVIPEDWEIDRIDALASITTGDKNTQDRIDDGAYPFFVRSSTVERINSHSFDGEAVLTAGDGVGTGKIYHYINGKFDFHQRVYKISNFSKRLDGYFFYLYFSSHFYSRIMQMTAKSSVDSIRRDMVADMKIPLPKLKEQRAIATALSDVDALMNSLEKLIAKKRNIKLGAMQELLAGRRRLPGFEKKRGHKQTEIGVIPEDWGVKPLEELFTFSGGLSASREQLSNDGFCYLHYGDIHKSTKSFIDVSNEYLEIPKLNVPLKSIPAKSLLSDGDVVFVDASEDDEGASKHIIVRNPNEITYISGLHTIVCKSKDDSLDSMYKQYCFQTSDIKRQFKFYAVGTKVTGINKANIAKIQIPQPPMPEQNAIAQVLSDMDTEIANIEEKLAKARQVKQGMMQELLTGRIRLV